LEEEFTVANTAKPVVMLHGWPYDIHSFADVTPALASAGYRVIVPFVAMGPPAFCRTTRCVTASKRL
jgi:pimeloyl-ACP methyl ester carboxylesterase